MPARRITKPVANPSASDRLRAALALGEFDRAADVAVEIGPSARERLPDELRPGFDAICDAFSHYEAADDDAVRTILKSIGLSSPFLEWKLLLRGLISFANGDTGRALDNWSRLAPDRRAARLVAALRFAVDPTFRQLQLPDTQARLRRQGDRLIGGLAPALRELQRLLARTRLDDAFRQAKALLPTLRREMPEAVERIADCFRAAIVTRGDEPDIDRYRKLFGAPADDPTLSRLEALLHEERHVWPLAHAAWQEFEPSIKENPAWTKADRDRARALVWCRMGRNAEEFGNLPPRLEPSAEACYKRAAELAPDLAEPQERLFELLRSQGRTSQALAAGKRLVARFPEHTMALTALAEVCREIGRSTDALAYGRRALALSPLDRSLRRKVAAIHRGRARTLAGAGKYATAQTELNEAVRLTDGPADFSLVAIAAVVAFKAGDTSAAEEHVRDMAAGVGPAAAYALTAEAIRFKLPRSLKQRFEKELAAALAVTATGPAAAALAGALLDQLRQGDYVGRKGHEKKVRTFVESMPHDSAAEVDLVTLCERLRDLAWWRMLKKSAGLGQKRFPRTPYFPFFEAVVHAEAADRHGPPAWKAEPLLEKARRLAAVCSSDDNLDRLLREVDELQRKLPVTSSFAHAFSELFETFSGG